MIDCTITTACYNRQIGLRDLIRSIKRSMNGNKVTHCIIDDGSDEPLTSSLYKYEGDGYEIKLFRQKENYGKEGYWETMTNLLNLAKETRNDYIVHIDDDMILCKDFFSIASDLIAQLPFHSLLYFRIDDRLYNQYKGMPVQWFDGCAIGHRKLYEHINWEPNQVTSSKLSSRHWKSFSYKLLDANPMTRIYYTDKSLVYHNSKDHVSVMHPKLRDKFPLETVHFIDNTYDKNVSIINPWKGLIKRKDPPVLLYPYEGFGNAVQSLGLYLQLNAFHGRCDVSCINMRGGEDKAFFYKTITDYLGAECFLHDPGDIYKKKIHASRARSNSIIGDVNTFERLCPNVLDHGSRITREYLPIDWAEFRGKKFTNPVKYDVVICNGGYNADAHWLRKRYQRWSEVAEILKSNGLSVASVGLPDEYIYGTFSEINIGIDKTCDLISSAGVFATGCTGLMHFANAIGVPTVAYYCATSTRKNLHKHFHRFTNVITADRIAGCHYCQNDNGKGLSEQWRNCHTWDCCYINPEIVAHKIMEVICSRSMDAMKPLLEQLSSGMVTQKKH